MLTTSKSMVVLGSPLDLVISCIDEHTQYSVTNYLFSVWITAF